MATLRKATIFNVVLESAEGSLTYDVVVRDGGNTELARTTLDSNAGREGLIRSENAFIRDAVSTYYGEMGASL